MASSATMQGLWGLIESMSLTNRNKKWLADKLMVSIPPKKVYSKEDQEILDGFREAIREWKDESIPTRPLDDSLLELKKEMEAEGYEFD